MSDVDLQTLDAIPGASTVLARALAGEAELPTAAALLGDLEAVQPRHGSAWSDPAFAEELASEHDRLGASEASRANLHALAGGAACVITGQQPGVLLGPLYCFYKILGAVSLARALSERHGRPFVPVYWCGADDSDFEEVRRAWMFQPGEGAFRIEVDAPGREAGQRIGDLGIDGLAATEVAALRRAGLDGRFGEALSGRDDSLADRARAWALRSFAAEGLVVVDARSPRLRDLGTPLFERYARELDRVGGALDRWSDRLASEGWPVAIDEYARASALFEVDGTVRRKIEPDRLRSGDFDPRSLAPSVLLRPVWQDALLAPVAAVLGPGELGYHVQLAAVYRALDVEAARPVARPHVVVVDRDQPWPAAAQDLRALFAGDVDDALLRAWLPADWEAALTREREATHARMRALATEIASARAAGEIERLAARFDDDLGRLRDRLAVVRATEAGVDPRRRAAWYAVRGVPQERVYAALQWFAWWGDGESVARAAVSEAYVRAIEGAQLPAWAVHGRCRSAAGGEDGPHA